MAKGVRETLQNDDFDMYHQLLTAEVPADIAQSLMKARQVVGIAHIKKDDDARLNAQNMVIMQEFANMLTKADDKSDGKGKAKGKG